MCDRGEGRGVAEAGERGRVIEGHETIAVRDARKRTVIELNGEQFSSRLV